MVVLLRPSEKQRLQRLARKERVSSAEILRRSFAAYAEPVAGPDDKMIAEMNLVLDKTLADIRSARESIRRTLDKAARRKAPAA